MLLKKFCSMLLALTLVIACIPGTMASAAESVWFDLEAESGTLVHRTAVLTDETTGRGYMISNDANRANSSTIPFSREASGTYDIWAVIGVDDSNFIGGYTFTLGSEEAFYSKSIEKANLDAVGDTLYTSDQLSGGKHHKPMKWVKLASGKTIDAGDHTLVAAVTKASATTNCFGVIDVVRFVPSSWHWTPASNFDAPTLSEWFDVEAEAGMGITNNSPTGYGVSNNSGLVGHNHPGDGSCLGAENTITVSVPAAGEYSVFAIVGKGDVNDTGNGRGSYKFSIDGTSFFESGVGTSISPISASFKQIALSKDTYAQRLYWINAGKVILPEGNVSLKLEVTSHGVIDCVRFVPSDWEWTPSGANLDAPTKSYTLKDRSFAWIEGEDMTPVNDHAKQVSVGKAGGTPSGGSEIFRNARSGADASFAPEFTVDFYVENAGTYEIWNYGYVVGGLTHFGKMVATINGVTTTGRSNYESVTNGEGGTDGQIKRWDRLAPPEEQQITLNAGWNTLNVKYLHGGTHNLFCTDAIAIVPTSWNWNPELESMKEGENPVNAYKMAPKLDAFSAGKYLGSKSGTVTENLTLADRGAAGSTITYVSTNPAISNTGVVTAPSRWDGDALGTIVATATKGVLSASTDAVNFTVEADALLNYSSFEIVGDIVSNGLVYAMANDVVSAHADAKTAVVILAVYKDDALLGVYPSEVKDITGEAQTIVSGYVTLPEDTTDVTVKAFIWNGLETAMPYVSPISK